MKVLIIDDDTQFLAAMETELHIAGFDTFAAQTPNLALRILLQHQIDAVILDINIPGMDGLSLTKEIRSKSPSIRIFLMTGHPGMARAVLARPGVESVFSKPINPDCVINQLLKIAA